MKSVRHTFFALLAALMLAAGGASCGSGTAETTPEVSTAAAADSTALAEGMRLYRQERWDEAREQLRVSARSGETYTRAESFLYLNALEMELGNYDAARAWLDRYHLEAVQLMRSAAEGSQKMAARTERLDRRQNALIGTVVGLVALVAGTGVWFLRRRGAPGGVDSDLPETGVAPGPDVDISEWRTALIDAEIFRQGPLWGEIAALGAQSPGRDARVLSSARQVELDERLAEVFARFSARLREVCPALTAGDLKFCCLSLLPLSALGRAACFGSVETNIVKQRKHTIKKKLCTDPRGRAIFDFIFEARG